MHRRKFITQIASGAAVLTLGAARERPQAAEHVAGGNGYLRRIMKHMNRVLDVGLDVYGPDETPMWLASIDVRAGGQYAGVTGASRRVYRQIHAPRGSAIYWDQPALAVAHLIEQLTGESRYARASGAYIASFLDRCVSNHNGFFLWGNHHYYDVFDDAVARIGAPIHEARPLPPAWPLFWAVDPEKTEQAIRAMGIYHIYDPETGEFCRHADTTATEPPTGSAGYAFIESGGIIAESLCWLGKQINDQALAELAMTIARYSFDTRSPCTGLMRNQSGTGNKRWDYHECTTEIGLWARSILRAAEYAGDQKRLSFQDMAREAVAAYLTHGFDHETGKYYGALKVDDGQPVLEFDTTYSFRPGLYADVWEPLFPTHDYPMSMAEVCVDLYKLTGERVFREGISRWVEHIRNSLPADYAEVETGFPSTSVRRAEGRSEPRIRGAYAGDYGRVIHFLARAAQTLDEPGARHLAFQLANEAVDTLYLDDIEMFRTNPARDTCDAVDEAGVLFLALLKLETGKDGTDWGFYF